MKTKISKPHYLLDARRITKPELPKASLLSGRKVRKSSAAAASQAANLMVQGARTVNLFLKSQNGQQILTQDTSVDLPPGTTSVLASVQGFLLTYGELNILDPERAQFEITDHTDHNVDVIAASISVIEVGFATAQLRATMVLRDDNGDDRWGGILIATVIFLGPQCS